MLPLRVTPVLTPRLMVVLVTAWVVLLAFNPASICRAQSTLPALSDGTELIITDEASEVILGYGTVSGGHLELNLSATTATMVVLFINPNGSFTTLRGYWGEDRRLWLTDEAMQELTNLETISRTANVALNVSGVAADAFVAGAENSDDDRVRPPAQLAQPMARPADSSAAASSRLGIGVADGSDDDDDHNPTTVSRNPDSSPPRDGVATMPAAPAAPEASVEDTADDDTAADDIEGDADMDITVDYDTDDGSNNEGSDADDADKGDDTDGDDTDGDADDEDDGEDDDSQDGDEGADESSDNN